MTNQEIEVVVKHFVQYLGNEAIMRIEKYEEEGYKIKYLVRMYIFAKTHEEKKRFLTEFCKIKGEEYLKKLNEIREREIEFFYEEVLMKTFMEIEDDLFWTRKLEEKDMHELNKNKLYCYL